MASKEITPLPSLPDPAALEWLSQIQQEIDKVCFTPESLLGSPDKTASEINKDCLAGELFGACAVMLLAKRSLF